MNSYEAGSQVKIEVTFKTTGGTGTDPTSCRLLYKTPNGTVTVKTTTDLTTGPSNGNYYYSVVPTSTQSGLWSYRYESTGTLVSSAESGFRVLIQDVST